MYSEDWQALGDVQFRKWDCYESLGWDISVDDHQVVGAPYGGPLAVLRDERKMSVASERLGGYLKIFSSSGKPLGQIEWEVGRKLACMGWTEAEELITILQDGTVNYYTIHGQKLADRELRLLGMTASRISEALVWPGGFVALSTDFTLHVWDQTRPSGDRLYRIPVRLSGERPMTAMSLLQPYYDSEDGASRLGSGRLQVLLATSDNSVVSVDELGMEDHNLQDSLAAPITKMAVSPDGRFLGCFTADGLLTVYTTKDFRRVLEPFETSTTSKPLGMVWCGKDSLVLYWRNMGLLMVGPFGDYIHFPYKQALALVPEPDCCRIVTSSRCEMLQRVPASTEAIRRIGSTEPAAMLYDAMEAFDEGDPKADENIRSIESGTQLLDAVKACVNAALSEWDESKQQAYLKAAAYGKGFLDEDPEHSSALDADEFVAKCRKLRVLNNLRRAEVGLPLTAGQYDRLSPHAIIERLTLRRQHFLALKISDYLRVKKDRVVIHWACEFIQSRKALLRPDEEVKDEIVARLKSAGAGNVSFALIARAADKARRRGLANMLLDYEPSPSSQVELLLEMGELELGLQKAIGASDVDLLCKAVLHVASERQTQQEALLKLLAAYPEALRLLRSYYRHKLSAQDRTPWFNMAMARGDILEAGSVVALQAYQQPTLTGRLDLLKEAAIVFGKHKATPFFQKSTEEQAELLEIQERLDSRSGKPEAVFVDLSVSETIYNLILLASDQPARAKDLLAEANNVMKKFKVPEKRFWHIKVKALAASGQWEALRQFAAEKKSPVGYKPFAQACIAHRQPATSTKGYIDRITQLEDKYDLYVEVKLWQDAADTALKMKDRTRLSEVQALCNMPGLVRAIDEQLVKL